MMLLRYFGELSSVIVDVFRMIRLDQCSSGHVSVWPINMTITIKSLACLPVVFVTLGHSVLLGISHSTACM